MTHRLLNIIIAGSLALAALPQLALAQTIKPGLWQIDNKMRAADTQTDTAMSAILQQLGNLPPDQRKALEDMAAQRGVAMPKIGADGAVTVSACITPEMAAKKQIPTGQPGDCRSNNVPLADGMQLSFTCANPQSSGEGKLTYQGDQAFTMAMKVNTSARGTPEQLTVNSSGRWLGATCPATAR
ncbi:DUF3617 domain-containing protein [Janthinobacterium agaricidamnosum]|uniref:DUF3617 domain-containing protein n=1 Tax=Janthinobacterium agaricidamnosum NBRC 102515 = DSM 9628 TaxID=1349767 RepID=W0V6C0_9BURK|nr:DUF3617 domain-containing protein [Janthinobacterium agaricidamnosum]CDG84374.1 hypothetical protein GJA_3760 [Janthinobacterium agaricidamnosum NBRC 102515 = DSM 9628]